MKVEIIRAWPRAFERVSLELPAGSTVAHALERAQIATDSALAVFGLRVGPETLLSDGDRIEVLRPLQMDPKDARRRRARTRQESSS